MASPPCRLRGHSPAKAQRNPGPPGKHPRGPSPCVYRPHHVALGHTPCSLGSWKHTGKVTVASELPGVGHRRRDAALETHPTRISTVWPEAEDVTSPGLPPALLL